MTSTLSGLYDFVTSTGSIVTKSISSNQPPAYYTLILNQIPYPFSKEEWNSACNKSPFLKNLEFKEGGKHDLTSETHFCESKVLEPLYTYLRTDINQSDIDHTNETIHLVLQGEDKDFFSLVLVSYFLKLLNLFGSCIDYFHKSFEEGNVIQIRRRFRIRDLGFTEEELLEVEKESELTWSEDIDPTQTIIPTVSMVVDHGVTSKKQNHLFNHLESSKTKVRKLKRSTTVCNTCGSEFSLINRIHHCRVCENVFCWNCIETIYLPDEFRNFRKESNNMLYFVADTFVDLYRFGKEPVCGDCMDFVSKESSVIGKALMVMGTTLSVLKKVATISSSWRRAALYCLNHLRQIQYQLPSHKLLPWEKQLLWRNRYNWACHDKWLIQFLKAFDWSNPEYAREGKTILNMKAQHIDCWEAMCTSTCTKSNIIEPEYAISLLVPEVMSIKIRRYATKCIQKASSNEIETYLPYLVYYMRYEDVISGQSPIQNLLNEISIIPENTTFRVHYYWLLFLSAKDEKYNSLYVSARDTLLDLIVTRISSEEKQQLTTGFNFVYHCGKLKSDMERACSILSTMQLMCPVLPDLFITKIKTNEIKFMESASVPVKINCLVKPYHRKTEKSISIAGQNAITDSDEINSISILFKDDDISNDYIVNCLIKRLNQIFDQSGLNFKLLSYEILKTGLNDGLIQMVDNSFPLSSLNETTADLWSFFTNDNTSKPEKIFDIFVRSVATYSVFTYLLNVGDRHLDNIMLSKNGEFFHIDYGFILGHEPKIKQSLGMGQVPVRIPASIRAAIRENEKTGTDLFIDYCCRVFMAIRPHYSLFVNLLSLLSYPRYKGDTPIFTTERIEAELSLRFLPGIHDSKAKQIFQSFISGGTDTIVDLLSDAVRDVKKRKLIQRFYQSTTVKVFELWQGLSFKTK